MGDMVYAATLSYYAQMIAQGKMATRPLNTEFELVGSSGIIGYKPKIAKRFGLPTGLSAGGMSCDLIGAHMAEQHNNDQVKHVQANQQIGMIGSSLEHQVLEQLFAQNGEQAFSAVKAIQLANEQGQKIYTITKDNYETIIPQLQLAPDAIADIRGAAMAGLTVTTHQKRISINGYTGEGYIILNERGTGSYMINGGLYGGFLDPVQSGQNTFMGVIFGISEMIGKGDWLIEGMFNRLGILTAGLGIANNAFVLIDNDCNGVLVALYVIYDLILQALPFFLGANPLIGLLMMLFAIVMQDVLISTFLGNCHIAVNNLRKKYKLYC